MSHRSSAVLALVTSMVLFAASYTITKVALVDLGPMTLGTVRFLLATLLIAAWLGVTRGFQRPTPRDAGSSRWAGCWG